MASVYDRVVLGSTEPSKNSHKNLYCLQQWRSGALITFLLYKQLSEPNTCGSERMSAMNNKLNYEYTDLSHEYHFIVLLGP